MHKLNPRTAALLSAFGWAVGYLLAGKALAVLLPVPPGGAARFCRVCLLAPLAVRFVTVTAHTPRAMPAEVLAEHIRAYGCRAEAADSIEAGVARAVELGGEGPVCALGTLYFSGDVRQAFARLNA